MTDRTKQKIKDVWNHRITRISTIATIIVACFTISFYSWTTFAKAKNIADTPEKLINHIAESNIKFERHEQAQKESFVKVDTTIKEHIEEQKNQFQRIEDKIDRKFDESNKKIDEINNKLYDLAKTFSRIEKRQDEERKIQTSIKQEFNPLKEN